MRSVHSQLQAAEEQSRAEEAAIQRVIPWLRSLYHTCGCDPWEVAEGATVRSRSASRASLGNIPDAAELTHRSATTSAAATTTEPRRDSASSNGGTRRSVPSPRHSLDSTKVDVSVSAQVMPADEVAASGAGANAAMALSLDRRRQQQSQSQARGRASTMNSGIHTRSRLSVVTTASEAAMFSAEQRLNREDLDDFLKYVARARRSSGGRGSGGVPRRSLNPRYGRSSSAMSRVVGGGTPWDPRHGELTVKSDNVCKVTLLPCVVFVGCTLVRLTMHSRSGPGCH